MMVQTAVQSRTISIDSAQGGDSFSQEQSGMDQAASLMDKRLSVLADRMDRITGILDRTSTGHYHRAITALDIANPAPLGFLAFALATALYMTQTAGVTEPATQFIAFPLGIFFGGLTMLLVSMWEIVRRNALGATAFGTYGAFWISAGVYGIIQTAGIFFLQAPKGMKATFALFGIAGVCFAVFSVAICLMLPFRFINIAIMFFLLAGGVDNEHINKVAGKFGIWTSSLALYQGMSFLFEDAWGKEVLPQFYTKPYHKHAVVLFPKISAHDTLAATAGYSKPGLLVHEQEAHEGAFRTPSLLTTSEVRQRTATEV